MFIKKYYDLVIDTCYEDPTKYKETTPAYLKPVHISWWNKLKILPDPETKTKAEHQKTFEETGGNDMINMKSCRGFIDFYQNVISLPCPFEIKIKYDKEKDKLDWVPNFSFNGPIEYQGYEERSHMPVITCHPTSQWGNAFPDMRQIKLSYPWYIQGPKNHKFLLTNNYWQTKKNIQVLNGVVEFYHMHQMHIQFFTEAKSQEIVFKYGESPAVLVPLRDKVKYKIHYNFVPVEQWRGYTAMGYYPYGARTIMNKYNKLVKATSNFTKIK